MPSMLIIVARLSDAMRPVRLKLDSGANRSFLYNTTQYLALSAFPGPLVWWRKRITKVVYCVAAAAR